MHGRIQNDGDWWLASICIRIEPLGSDPHDGSTRRRTWVNHHLIHAKTLAEAYDKAVQVGKKQVRRYKAGRGWMKHRFVGIWDILDIWDDIADGEEVFYTDYRSMTARVAKRRCVSKRQAIADYTSPIAQKAGSHKQRRTKRNK